MLEVTTAIISTVIALCRIDLILIRVADELLYETFTYSYLVDVVHSANLLILYYAVTALCV